MSLAARLRTLLRRGGGVIPKPPPLAPDEQRAVLSPGWNGPVMETSANYRRRDQPVWLRADGGHCRPGRCMGLMCCSYECSQGRCPSIPAEFREPTP